MTTLIEIDDRLVSKSFDSQAAAWTWLGNDVDPTPPHPARCISGTPR